MRSFVEGWHQAGRISLGLFWMAFWAFVLGYVISSMIQVFVTRERMRRSMGATGARSVGLGALFGFISSSCSFAALAATRSLFAKGAGFVPALAFLLASTNLVVELGIVIALFLGWQFVVAEYVGGVLLILLTWAAVRITRPRRLVERARERARAQQSEEEDGGDRSWRALIVSREGWRRVAVRYVMEWKMVWKDVAIGFAVAGIIAALVPPSFFRALFVGAGDPDMAFPEVVLQAVVGPIAAFFTFIGSMGNIPLAAVLFDRGVAFAGVLAFLFSDLVVFPVLRIQASYYGWRMALYIAGVFLAVLVFSAVLLHYGFDLAGLLPDPSGTHLVQDRRFFTLDYGFWLNVGSVAVTAFFVVWKWRSMGVGAGGDGGWRERLFTLAALVALTWVGLGMFVAPLLL